MLKFLWLNIDIHVSSNYKWQFLSVLEHKTTCTQRVKWQTLGTTKREIYVNKEKYFVINFLVELNIILHCRIDNLQDNSILHRGIPAAHTVYGVPRTINAAVYVHIILLNKVQRLNHPKAMALYTKHLLDMCCGQGMEIYCRENYMCPSVKEYQEIVKRSKDGVRTKSRI
jgi:geranylgeranyl pyrophosphate synthase